MFEQMLYGLPCIALFTLVPGLSLIFVARRRLARVAATQRLDQLEAGRSGIVRGRAVGAATTKGAISGGDAILVRYRFERRTGATFGAHVIVLETDRGERFSIAFDDGAFVSLGPHQFHEATMHHADNKPSDLRDYLLAKYGTQPFRAYATEQRIAPGDELAAVGTLVASSGPAPLELVGTKALPLAVGDTGLAFYTRADDATAQQMLGWVFVALCPIVFFVIALSAH